MPAIHDYVCKGCGTIWENEMGSPDSCEKCGDTNLEITLINWSKFNQTRDIWGDNELTDHNGFRRRFLASEDPTCQAELFGDDKGLSTFSPDQAQEYRERMMYEGDSPKLRRSILRQRAQNLKEQGLDAPDTY